MKKSIIVFLSLIVSVTCGDSYSYAEMTKSLKPSFTGQGVKVAVIDSGIDSTHPDLKKNYLKGYDFVDDDNNPEDTVGHGTHVAGIIAANGTMKGVAPDTSILAYRISPEASSEMIIKAINRAIEDGAHIINLSLGIPFSGTDSPVNQAIQKAIDKNITVVIAAGNSGPEQWSISSLPSTSEAISVGNAKQQGIFQSLFKISGTQHFIEFQAKPGTNKNLKPGEYSIVHLKSLTLENIQKQDNLKNTIVLFDSIDLNQYTDAVRELQKRGVEVLLSAEEGENDEVIAKPLSELNNTAFSKNNEASMSEGFLKKEEKQMLEKAAREQKVVTILQDSELRISSNSSRGPAIGSWGIKPDIAAPGVNIESTVPRNFTFTDGGKPSKKEGYDIMSGTSMAAPYVAGTAALIKQAHPDWSPYEIRAALTSTAKLIKDPNNNIVTPLAQGSGLVDIAKALEAEILPLTNNLSFGFLQSNSGVQTITQNLKIKNVSNSSQTLVTNNQTLEGNAEIKIPSSITIPPHKTIEIPVTLKVDTSLEISKHIGMLYLKQEEKQINIPYIVCVDSKDYPFLSMYGPLEISNDTFPYLLEYYSPFSVEQLTISITGQTVDNQSFSSVLMKKNTLTKGYQQFRWDGRDKNKEIVPRGNYNLTITAKDSSQSYQISQPLTISGVNKKALESPKLNPVTDQDTKVTGTGEKGADVSVVVDGQEIGSGKVDEKGNFEVDISKQPSGKEVFVTVTDLLGNSSEPTKTKVQEKDVTPSELPKVNPVTDQDIKVTGTGEKGAKVSVVVDGQEIGSGKVDEKGNFEVDIPKQPSGKEVFVTVTDPLGSSSEPAKIKVKIDPSKEGQKNINNDNQADDTNPEETSNGNMIKENGKSMSSKYQGNLPKSGGKQGMMSILLGLGLVTLAFFVRRMK
ncbi:S8 family serine peptidase [Bacillus toyonensis]|uniref:S8 family serine peptidase n=1 Tax=Bacillus toyonensis TaxID=155322 RepID=UPI003D24050A